jgi:Complex I intermediate-associated protein 30 (CIA30)
MLQARQAVCQLEVLCDTENNGGFASVRTRNIEPAADLAAYEGLALRVSKCIKRIQPVLGYY